MNERASEQRGKTKMYLRVEGNLKAARNLHSAEVTFATNDSHFVGYANRSCDATASAREENVNFKTRDSIRPS